MAFISSKKLIFFCSSIVCYASTTYSYSRCRLLLSKSKKSDFSVRCKAIYTELLIYSTLLASGHSLVRYFHGLYSPLTSLLSCQKITLMQEKQSNTHTLKKGRKNVNGFLNCFLNDKYTFFILRIEMMQFKQYFCAISGLSSRSCIIESK